MLKARPSRDGEETVLYDVIVDGEPQPFLGYGGQIGEEHGGCGYLIFPVIRRRGGKNEYSLAISGRIAPGNEWFSSVVFIVGASEEGIRCRVGNRKKIYTFPWPAVRGVYQEVSPTRSS